MKSNLPPLPRLDGKGVYRRWTAAIDELRHGHTFLLIQQVRGVLARWFAKWLLPAPAHMEFMGNELVDFVDVGAAGGLHRRWVPFSRYIRASLFEPEDAAYEELRKAHAGNLNMQIYPYALSADDAPLKINITAWPRASGSFTPDPAYLERTVLKNHLRTVHQISVNPRAMGTVLEHADFIKIDVEGLELSVLEGAARLLDQTLGLELEVSFFDRLIPGKPLFSEVDAFCRAKGFVLVKIFDTGVLHHYLDDRRYEIGGVLYGTNALYTRLPHELVDGILEGRHGTRSLWCMAVIYFVYGQIELARLLAADARRLGLEPDEQKRLFALDQALAHQAGTSRVFSSRTLRNLIELIGPLD